MPAWAASTSSSTTPISVTATPATASSLPIQPSEPVAAAGRSAAAAGMRRRYTVAAAGMAADGHRWLRLRCD